MKIFSLLSIFAILTIISKNHAYRILAVFPFNAKSHNIVFESLMRGLAKRGHQVDVVTHFPLKKPLENYNDIINLDGNMENLVNNFTMEHVSKIRADVTTLTVNIYGNRVCNFLALDSIQKLIRNPPKDPPYDLVITEAFCTSCYFGLGHIFKVPVIGVASALEYPWITSYTGNDDNMAYIPNVFFNKVGHMNYWERVKNFIINFNELRKYNDLSGDYQTEIMRKYISPDIPHVREVEKSVALILANNNPILFGVKPITPALIQIAGLHVEENDETLTPELKKWMDESKNGVVYFTLGSMVLIESLPDEQLKQILEVFGKLAPIRVLIKIVNKTKLPTSLPKNVKALTWAPQIPLLAHPNTKLFITHGGLGGVIEGSYLGVPMIGIPLFSDQFRNCEIFVAKKTMVTIDFKKLSGELLESALKIVLHDPSYKKRAVYYSKLFRDQPMSPMESAYFWIEYVIRNGPVLRSPALDYTWWQLSLLDVYALFLFIFVVGLISVIVIVRLILKKMLCVFSKKSYDKTQMTKKVQ